MMIIALRPPYTYRELSTLHMVNLCIPHNLEQWVQLLPQFYRGNKPEEVE